MVVLGIESSCDETAVALVEDGRRTLYEAVNSQIKLHEQFDGVVPEIACRAHVEVLLPLIDRMFKETGLQRERVEAVAVTTSPGLIGALLIGLSTAKALAWAWDRPLVAVNHVHAHIYAAWLDEPLPTLPAVSLVASGGHTSLFYVDGLTTRRFLGGTTDDAAGEAFDKVASILKLGYPGGPKIDAAARQGNPRAFDFPRTWIGKDTLAFSFSGIKTAVLYHCLGPNSSKHDLQSVRYEPQFVSDVAASFQEAVVDVLVAKTLQAAEQTGARCVIVGGGVAANNRLREKLLEAGAAGGYQVKIAARRYCTDNAVMVAGYGYHLLAEGQVAPLDVEASPR